MTRAQQDEFLDRLTTEVDQLMVQARTNAVNIAALAEATGNLKDAVSGLNECAEQERSRGDACRRDVEAQLGVLRDSIGQMKYIAGALSIAGGVIGAILGVVLS